MVNIKAGKKEITVLRFKKMEALERLKNPKFGWKVQERGLRYCKGFRIPFSPIIYVLKIKYVLKCFIRLKLYCCFPAT